MATPPRRAGLTVVGQLDAEAADQVRKRVVDERGERGHDGYGHDANGACLLYTSDAADE